MFSVLLQAVLICTSTWFLWKFFRQSVVKSNLDNIPGPASPSFWYGAYRGDVSLSSLRDAHFNLCTPCSAGHVQKLRDKQGWAFHQELADKYPAVVRLAGTMGVRVPLTGPS